MKAIYITSGGSISAKQIPPTGILELKDETFIASFLDGSKPVYPEGEIEGMSPVEYLAMHDRYSQDLLTEKNYLPSRTINLTGVNFSPFSCTCKSESKIVYPLASATEAPAGKESIFRFQNVDTGFFLSGSELEGIEVYNNTGVLATHRTSQDDTSFYYAVTSDSNAESLIFLFNNAKFSPTGTGQYFLQDLQKYTTIEVVANRNV